MTNDNLPTVHDQANESLARRLSDAMLRLRSGTGHISQAIQSTAGSDAISTDAAGMADAGRNHRGNQTPTSTGSGSAGEGGMVCEGEGVRYELYQPKGSMCMACAFKNQDCSSLDFSKMKVMLVRKDTAVVRCTAFIPAKPLRPIA